MSLDIDTKKIAKNAYRITKVRGKTALRIRVPGGHLEARFLSLIKTIAETYGDGTVHLTTRQGFEIPGIKFEQIPTINELIKPLIKELISYGVEIRNINIGYPAAGTRNVSACIGNRVCRFSSIDTTKLAQDIEKTIFPNNYHMKIAISGCPNDCIKAHMQDIGIIGMTVPIYNSDYCIGCEACVKNCKGRVTQALTLHNNKVKRDIRRCIGCGECVLTCPTGAWSRNPEKYFRLIIMGRTGKKNPRLAKTFLTWVKRGTIMKIIENVYDFIEKYIDRSLPKEHVGYIVDRIGYGVFRDFVLKHIELNERAKIAEYIDFGGYKYEKDIFFNK